MQRPADFTIKVRRGAGIAAAVSGSRSRVSSGAERRRRAARAGLRCLPRRYKARATARVRDRRRDERLTAKNEPWRRSAVGNRCFARVTAALRAVVRAKRAVWRASHQRATPTQLHSQRKWPPPLRRATVVPNRNHPKPTRRLALQAPVRGARRRDRVRPARRGCRHGLHQDGPRRSAGTLSPRLRMRADGRLRHGLQNQPVIDRHEFVRADGFSEGV